MVGAVALVAGLLLGPLDLAGQVHSPYPYANLFNSPAVWAAAALVFGRWATNLVPAIVGAVVVLALVAVGLALRRVRATGPAVSRHGGSRRRAS